MKLITERDLILNVAKKWYQQYAVNYSSISEWANFPDKKEIYDKLVALNKTTATREDVAKIIGNDSWTRITCGECHRDVAAVIRCGAEPDYESATAYICRICAFTMTSLWERDSSWSPK